MVLCFLFLLELHLTEWKSHDLKGCRVNTNIFTPREFGILKLPFHTHSPYYLTYLTCLYLKKNIDATPSQCLASFPIPALQPTIRHTLLSMMASFCCRRFHVSSCGHDSDYLLSILHLINQKMINLKDLHDESRLNVSRYQWARLKVSQMLSTLDSIYFISILIYFVSVSPATFSTGK